MAEWWYNTSHHTSINMTPYQALYGKKPPSFNYHQAQHTKNDCINTFLRQRAEMQVLLKNNLTKAQERMTYYANKKWTDRSFQEGDEVFLKVQAFRQTSLKSTKDNKFSPKYYGPFKILKKIGSVAYRLQLPATARIHNTFHVSLLKKKVGDASLVASDLPIYDSRIEDKVPERILDRRLIKKNNSPAALVLIQWKDSLPEDATWEEYAELLRKFPWFTGEGAAAQEKGIVTNGV